MSEVPRYRLKSLHDVTLLWAARIVASFSSVAVLAVAARSLSVDMFAAFAFLMGLVAWLPVLDFGFGSVMQNNLVGQGIGERNRSGVFIACLLFASGLALVSATAATAGLVAWRHLSGGAGLYQYAGAMVLTVWCLSVTGVSLTIHKVYAATNRLSKSALLSVAQNLLALGSLMLVGHLSAGSPDLLTMLASYLVPYTLVPLVVLLGETCRARRASLGEIAEAWRERALFRDAMKFWFVLALSLVVVLSDQFIAYKYLSPSQFAHYAVATKLISFVYFPFAALLMANWSRVSEAHFREDRSQVLGIVHSSVLIGVAYLVVALVGLLMVRTYFSNLLPQGIGQIEIGLLVGVWLVVFNKVWTESYALAYLATGHAGVIASFLPFQAAIAVGLELLLVGSLGVYGLMIGGALSYFATSHWILYFRTKDVFRGYSSMPQALGSSVR